MASLPGLPDSSCYSVFFAAINAIVGGAVKAFEEGLSTRKGKFLFGSGLIAATMLELAAVGIDYGLKNGIWPGWQNVLVYSAITIGVLIWGWGIYNTKNKTPLTPSVNGIQVQYLHDPGDASRDMDRVFESAKSRMDILVATGSTLMQLHANKITACVEEAAKSKGKWRVRFIFVNPDNPKILESLRATTGDVPDRLAEQARTTRDKLTELQDSYPKAIKFYLIDDLAPTFSMWIVGDGSRVTANLKTFFLTDNNGAVFRANDPKFVEQCSEEFETRWKLLERKSNT